jgi:hypothetical protein
MSSQLQPCSVQRYFESSIRFNIRIYLHRAIVSKNKVHSDRVFVTHPIFSQFPKNIKKSDATRKLTSRVNGVVISAITKGILGSETRHQIFTIFLHYQLRHSKLLFIVTNSQQHATLEHRSNPSHQRLLKV